ncbi:hypothetical protein BK141_22040 [Paenibacillus sp. FSL R5-0765]|nr:hypothetical protein BK141_22040 [Paenibacillus sp. FSL R5-0765]
MRGKGRCGGVRGRVATGIKLRFRSLLLLGGLNVLGQGSYRVSKANAPLLHRILIPLLPPRTEVCKGEKEAQIDWAPSLIKA